MKIISYLVSLTAVFTLFSCQNQSDLEMVMCHSGAVVKFADFSFDPQFRASHPVPVHFSQSFRGDTIEFSTPDGKKSRAYFVESKTGEQSDQFLLLFHEWWGLNDYIRSEADAWSEALNINVLALDLYDGQVATSAEIAGKLMRENDVERSKNIIRGAMQWAGSGAKFHTMGWCFGGGWSFTAALLAEKQAASCVIFYGKPDASPEMLEKLNCEVLFIHPTKDKWITHELVEGFKEMMANAGHTIQIHEFDADHAFANPSSARFNPEAAAAARAVTLEFLTSKK